MHRKLAVAVAVVLAAGLGSMGAALARLPAPSDQGFTDIEGSPHEDAINQLAEVGILNGKTPTEFAPNDPATRGQAASMLARAIEATEEIQLVIVADPTYDTFVLPDGTTYNADNPPPDDFVPQVGMTSFFVERIHETSDGVTPGAQIGQDSVQCTVASGAGGLPSNCHVGLLFDDGSALYATFSLDFFTEFSSIHAAVVGGTGAFAGVHGAAEVVDSPDFEETGISYLTLTLNRL